MDFLENDIHVFYVEADSFPDGIFHELLKQPDIDPTGYCLEIYEGMANVRCMVPLKS
jgi:hypothetical protein